MSIGTPVAGTKDDQTAASTTSTPSWPSPITLGDFVLAWGINGTTSPSVFSAITGFTTDAQDSSTGDTTSPACFVAHKTTPALGTETGTQSCSHTSSITTMGLAAFPGVDTVSPIDVGPILQDPGAAASTLTWPSQTVLTDGSTLVVVGSTNSTTTTLTGFTVNGVAGTILANRTKASARSGGVAYIQNLPAGATGLIVLTFSGSARSIGHLYILKPAATAGAPASPTRRGLKGLPTRRPTRPTALPLAADVLAASPPRRSIKGIAVRRRTRAQVVPPQIVVTPPAYVPAVARRGFKGWQPRRRTRVQVVPPQIVVTPPSFVVTIPRRGFKGLAPRRRTRLEVVPAQILVAPPSFVATIPPKHVLRAVPRRGRRAEVPPAQAPAHRGQPRRPLRVLARRVGHAIGVLTTVTVPATDTSGTAGLYTATGPSAGPAPGSAGVTAARADAVGPCAGGQAATGATAENYPAQGPTAGKG